MSSHKYSVEAQRELGGWGTSWKVLSIATVATLHVGDIARIAVQHFSSLRLFWFNARRALRSAQQVDMMQHEECKCALAKK